LELLKKYKRNELNPVFNKKLPWIHKKLDFDMLGTHGKLVKYVVPSSKRIN
jgi:hypothetical protein